MAISRSEALGPWTAAAAVPASFGPWLREQYLLPKLAAAALFTAVGLAWMAKNGGIGAARSRVDAPLAAFCAAALLSALCSVDGRLSWYGHDKEYLFSLAGLAGCVVAFYLGCALERGGRTPTLLRWIVAGSLPISVYACLQGLGLEIFRGARISLPMGRGAVSTLGSPVYLGAYLALLLPPALSLCRGAAGRGLGRAALGLALPALALTMARGAWLGAALGAGVYLALSGAAARRSVRGSWAAGLALGVLLAGAAATRLRVGASLSDSVRWETWRIACLEARERPWIGSGMDTFVIGFRRRKGEALARMLSGVHVQSHAHNDWLQVLATMGLLGAAAYAWLHLGAWRGARAALREHPDRAAAAAGAVAGVLLLSKFNSPSFGVAWLASLLAGTLLASGRAAVGRSGRAAPALLCLAAFWFCFATAKWVAADRRDLLGRRARAQGRPREAALHFEGAAALNPGVAAYRFDWANLLWDSASAASSLADKRLLLAAAAEAAVGGVRARPLDAEALRLLGLAQLRRAQWGGENTLPLARSALEAALVLDPYYAHTLAELSRVAALQGDGPRRREMEARLDRIGVSSENLQGG